MYKYLSKVDLFGVEDKLQIQSQNPKQQSGFGGIMTIILYGISMAYFLSEIIEWAQNKKLPKITTIKSLIESGETIQLTGRFLEIESEQFNDPFNFESMILVPEVRLCLDQNRNCDYFQMQYESIANEKGQYQNKFFLEYDQIIGSPNKSPESTIFSILFNNCIGSSYSEDNSQYKCASQSDIDTFTSAQTNQIKITFNATEFNTKTRELFKIPKSIVRTISSQIQQSYQLNLQVNNLEVDEGILFNQIEKLSYISDYKVETSGLLVEAIKGATLILEFRLDQIKSVTYIEYSKISEILADTGAIISWILYISFIVQEYNKKISSDKTIDEIIKMFFPDYSNMSIRRNIKGHIISAQIQDKWYDPKKMNILMKRITDIANLKVSFINLQYEVSRYIIILKFRLQILLTKQLGISCIKNCLNPENKIENFLDTYGYRIKSNQAPFGESKINIVIKYQLKQSSEYRDKRDHEEIEGSELEYLEQNIGLLTFVPALQKDIQLEQSKIEKEIDLSIIPKECLKQEDLSGLNSQH